jgi:ABC-type glutathione transport system ATPase component
VAQLTGVHKVGLNQPVSVYLSPLDCYVFERELPGGQAVPCCAPAPRREAEMARITLDLAHAYRPRPQQDSDYALLPLQMEFEDGGAYALLGPSGCGKTTMLNIMSGLLVPSQGKVLFDGRDVTRASSSSATSPRCSSSR